MCDDKKIMNLKAWRLSHWTARRSGSGVGSSADAERQAAPSPLAARSTVAAACSRLNFVFPIFDYIIKVYVIINIVFTISSFEF